MAHVFFEKLEPRKSTQVLWTGYSAPSNYYSAYYPHQAAINQNYYQYLSAINVYNTVPVFNTVPVLNYPNYFPWDSPYYQSGYYHPYPNWYTAFNPQRSFGIGNWFFPVWNNFQDWFRAWNLQRTQSMNAMDRIENAIKRALNI